MIDHRDYFFASETIYQLLVRMRTVAMQVGSLELAHAAEALDDILERPKKQQMPGFRMVRNEEWHELVNENERLRQGKTAKTA